MSALFIDVLSGALEGAKQAGTTMTALEDKARKQKIEDEKLKFAREEAKRRQTKFENEEIDRELNEPVRIAEAEQRLAKALLGTKTLETQSEITDVTSDVLLSDKGKELQKSAVLLGLQEKGFNDFQKFQESARIWNQSRWLEGDLGKTTKEFLFGSKFLNQMRVARSGRGRGGSSLGTGSTKASRDKAVTAEKVISNMGKLVNATDSYTQLVESMKGTALYENHKKAWEKVPESAFSAYGDLIDKYNRGKVTEGQVASRLSSIAGSIDFELQALEKIANRKKNVFDMGKGTGRFSKNLDQINEREQKLRKIEIHGGTSPELEKEKKLLEVQKEDALATKAAESEHPEKLKELKETLNLVNPKSSQAIKIQEDIEKLKRKSLAEVRKREADIEAGSELTENVDPVILRAVVMATGLTPAELGNAGITAGDLDVEDPEEAIELVQDLIGIKVARPLDVEIKPGKKHVTKMPRSRIELIK